MSYDSNVFEVRVDAIGFDPRTTIMIRNIPNKYTIKDLSEEIDFYFGNTYDFLYLPCDFKVIFFSYRTTATSATVSLIS